jgi:hypothetical protein
MPQTRKQCRARYKRKLKNMRPRAPHPKSTTPPLPFWGEAAGFEPIRFENPTSGTCPLCPWTATWVQQLGCSNLGAATWVQQLGYSNLGAATWLQQLGCSNLGAATWLQQLGYSNLGAATWLQQLGCSNLGAATWVQQLGYSNLGAATWLQRNQLESAGKYL